MYKPEPSRVLWLQPHTCLVRHSAKPLPQAPESPMYTEGLLQAWMTREVYSTGDSLPFLLKPSFGIEIDHSPLIKREKNTLLSWVRSIHTVTGNHCIYHIPVEAVLALRQPQSPFHAHSADVPITQQRHKPTLKWRAFQYLFKVFFPKIQLCHPTGELGLKRQARQVDKWWL